MVPEGGDFPSVKPAWGNLIRGKLEGYREPTVKRAIPGIVGKKIAKRQWLGRGPGVFGCRYALYKSAELQDQLDTIQGGEKGNSLRSQKGSGD